MKSMLQKQKDGYEQIAALFWRQPEMNMLILNYGLNY